MVGGEGPGNFDDLLVAGPHNSKGIAWMLAIFIKDFQEKPDTC